MLYLTIQRDSGRWWASTDSEVCLTIQRDSGHWWASTDSEGRLTIVNVCFDSTML